MRKVRRDVKPKLVRKPVPEHTFTSKNAIAFTSAKLPYGWLGNMSGGYPIRHQNIEYLSSEALFQCLRFPADPEAQEAIRSAKSPLWAKKRAIPRAKLAKLTICDGDDLARMKVCLVLKLAQNPQLITPLLETGLRDIIEDCTARPNDTEIDGKNHFAGKPYWGAAAVGSIWEGNNALGRIWMQIRDELRSKGEATAMSPQGDKVVVRADTPLGKSAFAEPPLVDATPLSAAETKMLKECEDRIEKGRAQVEQGFINMVEAMHEVYEHRLYRDGGRTFASYFREKWSFERAHSYRLVHCGRLLKTMKSGAFNGFTSQAHFRPLLAVGDDTMIQQTLNRIEGWKKEIPNLEITPALVESSAVFDQAPVAISVKESDAKIPTSQVMDYIAQAQEKLTVEPKKAALILTNLQKDVEALGRKSTTGISWTDATWNPLQGCKKISAGCQYCYAATLLATRLKSRYPGIAEQYAKKTEGRSPYYFTGEVRLLVDALAEPINCKTPKRYFVNSLSDLFFEKVPDWFIEQVFDVMEMASWHQFQVLTKRPERMAAFTTKRYATKTPPGNIWLGATIENQAEHARRMPHLAKVVAAVRWLSCEPLLGPLKLNLSAIHWVIVGGESGSERKMERTWAASIRDQCIKAGVPFFFKQWGNFDEAGNINRHKKTSGRETLCGAIHDGFPSVSPTLPGTPPPGAPSSTDSAAA